MKKIDVCGKPCPAPVIATKKAIEKDPGSVLKVKVDDEAARVNVTRYAKTKKYSIKEEKSGEITELILEPRENNKSIPNKKEVRKKNEKVGDTVFFLDSFKLGNPDDELGELLIKTFFQTVPDVEPLPGKIVFMHGGVKHTVEGAENAGNIKDLEKLGIDIVVCGTCLDYYGLKDKLAVGRISNFFEIASILNSASNTVTL